MTVETAERTVTAVTVETLERVETAVTALIIETAVTVVTTGTAVTMETTERDSCPSNMFILYHVFRKFLQKLPGMKDYYPSIYHQIKIRQQIWYV